MLRRNYRRTRSDETDVRSATGEELTGVMNVSPGEGRPQSTALTAAAAAKHGGIAMAGNGTLAAGSRSAVVAATADDDGAAGDSADGSPCTGHRQRHHRLVTPTASCRSTPFRGHNPSVGSTDTEMTSLDTRELWLPDTEPTPSTMSALHQFGAEMLRLSRGLEKVASPDSKPTSPDRSRLSDRAGDSDDDDGDVEYVLDDDDDDDDDERNGNGDEPFDDGACDSMCSEDATAATGTPRCRRAKRQRRRRRRRSGTLHESMRRRFDGHNHHHLPHPYYRHPHHHHHHHPSTASHHRGRPTRVRSFHEDELRRHHRPDPTSPVAATAAAVAAVADTGPKIVGTLLKPEYQRKPGLDEEICLLPPPPRRRRRPCSASTSSGDTTAAPSPSPVSTHRRPAPVERTPPRTPSQPPTPRQQLHQQQQQQQQQKQRHAATVTEWSAASNASTTTLAADCGGQPLRRAMTQKLIRKRTPMAATAAAAGDRHSPLTRYGSTLGLPSSRKRPQQQQVQAQKSNSASRSSVMIRNSYRHGRIIRLEQKATKVLGVVFFTFVFLWTPFFALNLLPSVCPDCEANTNKGLIDLVTWLGYASSMVNPVFYTIFNKVFRQAFKRVLMCKYSGRSKRHSWPPAPPARKV